MSQDNMITSLPLNQYPDELCVYGLSVPDLIWHNIGYIQRCLIIEQHSIWKNSKILKFPKRKKTLKTYQSEGQCPVG